MAPTASNQQDVQPLPSLPPSPTTEEDLGGAHAWGDVHEPDNLGVQRHDKGKRRETQLDVSYADGEDSTSDESLQPHDASESTPDDEEDTRRVEENLRRWEQAERQRRKAARAGAIAPTSLIGEVALRASFLWPSRMLPFGNHTALRSHESLDADVPLTDLGAPSSAHSTNPLPYASSPDASRPASGVPSMPTTPTISQDPFANPPTPGLGPIPSSPLEDTLQATALLSASSEPRSPDTPRAGAGPPPGLPRTPSSHTRIRPPPPRPLDLPPPRTPPPPLDTLPANSPPTATQPSGEKDDVKVARWWHDWLCGCGEGPDRGGDYQAGRTNPFE